MTAPDSLLQLVQRFEEHRASYLSGKYNETQLRRDFIDPFFAALGWDVSNQKNYSERYREVFHEVSVEVEGGARAADYAFRVGEKTVFFVEAKKPSANIETNPEPAFQLRRYGWSARLPISLLSDFEHLAVYDCRMRPVKTDRPSLGRVRLYHYSEYIDQWDQIAALFSHEAVMAGAFDQFAAGTAGRKGTTEVDDAFLAEIERWRDLLARNIALRNPSIENERELNFAVQMTIDRIIFLRICEDRGIEPDQQLHEIAKGTGLYPELLKVFQRADTKYNSGLFHFADDAVTPGLVIDDKVLKDILHNLYYPESPYVFTYISADILGQVYEQFLGKVIRLTPAHQAKVELKPEVRKAGGVYYTPTYIVDYIVRNTVGELLKDKTPREVASLRILDPACGSGSFLLGAYQVLLDWHASWYAAHDPEKWARGSDPIIYHAGNGEWRLTASEKKRILLDNIFGVDIDLQAVEVTRLSLLLKVLEGAGGQMTLGLERVLPDLDRNIQCGNSLIGPDYFDGKLFPDEEERYRVNPFNWQAAFPQIFSRGGFDAVIGNPPWGGDIDNDLEYFHAKYPESTKDHTDSFKLFIEKALNLVKHDGLIAMIVPNTLLRQRRLMDVRHLLLQTPIINITDLGEDVFEGVVAPSCVFVARKGNLPENHIVELLDVVYYPNSRKALLLQDVHRQLNQVYQKDFQKNAELEFRQNQGIQNSSSVPLGNLTELDCKDAGINYQRVNVGMQEKGKSDLSERLLYEGKKQNSSDKMFWKGTDIDRYWIDETTNRYCRPYYRDYIKQNEVVHLSEVTYNTAPKILLRQTADHVIATIDFKGVWFGRSIIALVPTRYLSHRLEYFLALLNSNYFKRLYFDLVKEKGRVFAQVKLSKIKQLHIRLIDFSNPAEKAAHDRMVSLVERMLALHKQSPRTPQEKEMLQREIESTDQAIDALVYQLYGLTEEEIRIVEGR